MTLRALIVEDEPLAARRLADMLGRQPEPVQVLGTAESVARPWPCSKALSLRPTLCSSIFTWPTASASSCSSEP